MPAGDGTGPNGLGPMTGRSAGYCAGYAVPGALNPLPGRGGRGRGGGGRGWRHRNVFRATGQPGWMRAQNGTPVVPSSSVAPTPEQQLAVLYEQVETLEGTLTKVRREIEELQAKGN